MREAFLEVFHVSKLNTFGVYALLFLITFINYTKGCSIHYLYYALLPLYFFFTILMGFVMLFSCICIMVFDHTAPPSSSFSLSLLHSCHVCTRDIILHIYIRSRVCIWEKMWYFSFWGWYILLNVMISSFIHFSCKWPIFIVSRMAE
jgi:hypothetical protein